MRPGFAAGAGPPGAAASIERDLAAGTVCGNTRLVRVVLAVAAPAAAHPPGPGDEGPLRVSGFLEAGQIRAGSRVGDRVLAVRSEGDAAEAGSSG